MIGLDENVIEKYQDRQVNIIQRFDKIIFNLDLIKSIINYHPLMDDIEIRLNLYKYGKEYSMHRWTRLPDVNEIFQIRRRYVTNDNQLFFEPCSTKYTKAKDIKKALTNTSCSASLIQRIFWYDKGNSKIDSNKGYHKGWEHSKCNGIVFISQAFNSELFKDYNWEYYSKFISVPKGENQAVILPYNKMN